MEHMVTHATMFSLMSHMKAHASICWHILVIGSVNTYELMEIQ